MKQLVDLLSPYFCDTYGIDYGQNYSIEYVDAKDLLTPNRLDLIAKLIWLHAHISGQGTKFADELYDSHIVAITEGKCKEPGKEKQKKSLKEFRGIFKELLDIKDNGFDVEKSLIPVGKNNTILDGAHRVAICIYYNMKVPIVRFSNLEAKYDAKYFKNTGFIDDSLVEAMVATYLKLTNKNVYVACIWPKANDEELRLQSKKIISDSFRLIYVKDVKMTFEAIRNIIIQVYSDQSWLGTCNKHFPGAIDKANNVWDKSGNVTFVFFEGGEYEKVKELKDIIRGIFDIGKDSIHISDNSSETINVSNIVLNSNSLDLLMNSTPDKYPKVNELINDYKNRIVKHGYDIGSFIIDSSSIMSLYGLRESQDIDYLSLYDDRIIGNDKIECHNMNERFHSTTKDELIINPQKHLYFCGVKFVTLEELKVFKKNRLSGSDQLDIKLIDAFMKHNRSYVYVIRHAVICFKRKIRIAKTNLRLFLRRNKMLYAMYHWLKDRGIKL